MESEKDRKKCVISLFDKELIHSNGTNRLRKCQWPQIYTYDQLWLPGWSQKYCGLVIINLKKSENLYENRRLTGVEHMPIFFFKLLKHRWHCIIFPKIGQNKKFKR